MEKLLTIIIPAYNMEAYLNRCVSSMLLDDGQMLSLLEIIIVNDGSVDNTSNIAHSFRSRYLDSIVVIDKENGNYGSCVNAGLAIARGKYVKILDADDWFETSALSVFVRNLVEIEADLVVTEFNKVDCDKHVLWQSQYGNKYETLLHVDSLNIMEPMQMHALCYRTELLREHNYQQTEGISYTDTEWAMLPMLYVRTFVCLPIYLYQYLVGRDGQTMDMRMVANRADHFVKTYTKCLKWMKQEASRGISSLYCKQKLYCCLQYFYFTILVDAHGQNADRIIDFDKYLQLDYPSYYQSLEEEIMSPSSQFHYIQEWRKNGYMVKTMPWKNRIRDILFRTKMRVEWHWRKLIA